MDRLAGRTNKNGRKLTPGRTSDCTCRRTDRQVAPPGISAAELERLGYRVVVCPVASLVASGAVFRRLAQAMRDEGHVDHLAAEMMTFDDVKRTLRVSEFTALEERRAELAR